MVGKESILTLLDNEINKMAQFYEEKTEKLQRDIVILNNGNSSLHSENEELQKAQINPSVENDQEKYERLLTYITEQSGGIPTDLIDQLCLSASRTDALILIEIFLESLHTNNDETSLYILHILDQNHGPLLHEHDEYYERIESV